MTLCFVLVKLKIMSFFAITVSPQGRNRLEKSNMLVWPLCVRLWVNGFRICQRRWLSQCPLKFELQICAKTPATTIIRIEMIICTRIIIIIIIIIGFVTCCCSYIVAAGSGSCSNDSASTANHHKKNKADHNQWAWNPFATTTREHLMIFAVWARWRQCQSPIEAR